MWPQLPPGVSPAAFIICTALAALVTGIAKAGFGGGIGIVAVPLTVAVIDPQRGLGLMLPLLVLGDFFSVIPHRRNVSPKHLRWLVTGGVVGVIVAAALLVWLRAGGDSSSAGHARVSQQGINRMLNLVVGGVCLAMVAAQAWRLCGGKFPHFPPTAPGGLGVGAFSGFVSTLAHSAGPLINVYLLEQKLNKNLQVGTSVLFFLVINLSKVPIYLWVLHLLTPETFLASVLFMPLVPVGAAMGWWMHQRVAEKPFMIIMYLGAAAGAAWMIYKGIG